MKSPIRSKTYRCERRRPLNQLACVERLELRRLLTAYGLSTVAAIRDTGTNSSDVVRDSSGNLYGTTSDAGEDGDGTIYEVASGSGKVVTLVKDNPVSASNLTIDSAGNLYETNGASIYEVVKGSGKAIFLAEATTDEYASQLTVDSNGNLYGTEIGDPGASVFELAKGSSSITILANFASSYNINPSSLAIDSNGDLFGTVQPVNGGIAATAFEVVKGSGVIKTLATYSGDDAGISAPIVDSNGNLYGTLNPGEFDNGSGGKSTVFEVLKGSGKFTTLATFSSAVYLSSVVRDTSGDLFGTVQGTDGVSNNASIVFEVANGSGKVTTLGSFVAGITASDVVLDSAGDLYGTTSQGDGTTSDSSVNDYSIFEVGAGTSTTTTLANVTEGSDDLVPSSLISDSGGDLFGTLSPMPGDTGTSSLFEIVHGSGKFTTRITFSGQVQASALVMDAKGDLYGTLDPATGDASIFEVGAGSTKVTTLASFGSGDVPSSLVIDSAGDLFGITASTIFEVAAGSKTIKTLVTVPTNDNPSSITIDSGGNLYGTLLAPTGSYYSPGYVVSIFEIAKGSGKMTTLATFSEDLVQVGGIVVNSSGDLFLTAAGFEADGYLYEVAKGSKKITTLSEFSGPNGLNPLSALIAGNGDTVYGSTSTGGTQGGGTIFKLTPTSGPFFGTPAPFGLIQAENFDYGGQNVGYYDPGNVNKGGAYRPSEGVGIGAAPSTEGGGYFVGWTVAGEWLDYTVDVAATGTYTLNFRAASDVGGGTFHMNVDGTNVTGELTVPNTGSWNTYETVSKTGVHLTAGVHVLRLQIDSTGTYPAAGNFDWIQAVET